MPSLAIRPETEIVISLSLLDSYLRMTRMDLLRTQAETLRNVPGAVKGIYPPLSRMEIAQVESKIRSTVGGGDDDDDGKNPQKKMHGLVRTVDGAWNGS